LFDHSDYDKIKPGMTLQEIQGILGYPPGAYPPRQMPKNPARGHSASIGSVTERTSWTGKDYADTRLGAEYWDALKRTKYWLGSKWGIDVVFDDAGKAASKSFSRLRPPEYDVWTAD
jgi:hypothetical protein